jgi:hypothetical protein
MRRDTHNIPSLGICYEIRCKVGIVTVAVLRSMTGELVGLSMVCRECGCVEWAPCRSYDFQETCRWVDIDLCSCCNHWVESPFERTDIIEAELGSGRL